MPTNRSRRWAAVALGVYAAIVLVVALVPRPIDEGVTPWVRGMLAQAHRHGLAGWITYDVVEFASHVVVFMPIGILAVVALGRRMAWLAVLAGLGMCALVEFGTSWAAGEPPSMVDLTLDAVGAVAGAAIGYAVLTGLRPRLLVDQGAAS